MASKIQTTRAALKTVGGVTLRTGGLTAAWLKKNHKRVIGVVVRTLPPKTILPPLLQHPSQNYSIRGVPIDLVVLHDTEGAYSAAVSWLSNPAAQASAHVVLREDGKQATQLVRWSKKAWSCVNFNSRSLNLEMAGKASVGYSAAEIESAAAIVAYWCKLYKIPVRDALGGKQSGITFHQDLGVAGGGHHDPGWSAAQKASFIEKVKVCSGSGFSPSPGASRDVMAGESSSQTDLRLALRAEGIRRARAAAARQARDEGRARVARLEARPARGSGRSTRDNIEQTQTRGRRRRRSTVGKAGASSWRR
jgi:hypothetical protein